MEDYHQMVTETLECNLVRDFFSPFGPLRHFICMHYIPRKRLQGFYLLCVFFLLLNGSMVPADVVSTMKPN